MQPALHSVDFLRYLDEILELEPGTLNGTEVLETLEGWDSLAVISFIAMVDERYGIVVEGEKLAKAVQVNDLVNLVANRLQS